MVCFVYMLGVVGEVFLIYGAFSTVIIMLLGAQVIAEYERIGGPSTKTHGLQT